MTRNLNVVISVHLLYALFHIASIEGNNYSTSNNLSGAGNATVIPTTSTEPASIVIDQESSTKSLHTVTVDGPGSAGGTQVTPHTNENGTTSAIMASGSTQDEAELPMWVYILTGCVIVILLGAIVSVGFVKYDKWKNQGSYMVWDNAELQLSPAFISRESEFLIDNLAVCQSAADQEPGSPELQLYEIPLDSLGHQRVYIGPKRVAPRRQARGSKDINKIPKGGKKKERQFQMHTLPRLGKRDPIYNSISDRMNSALGEGNVNEDMTTSGHTLANRMHLDGKSGSLESSRKTVPPSFMGGSLRNKFITLGSIGRSGSTHLFQNRPLPAAPSKRLSKSIDRLQFLELFPNTKHSKAATIQGHSRPLPVLPSRPPLVKSISCGNNIHQIIVDASENPTGLPPAKKSSLNCQEHLDSSRNFSLSHRHSKSLDTLLLLKELDWMSFDIDTHHSYESMSCSRNKMDDPPYASVETSNQTSPRSSNHNDSSSTSQRTSHNPSDGEDCCNWNEEHPYASVSNEEHSNTESLLKKYPSCSKSETSDVSVPYPSVSSENAVPYASVRISQIPGIGPSQDSSSHGEEGIYSGEVFEDSGSSIDTITFSNGGVSSARPASTLTYLEIMPDNARASVISETSSGYARPIDIIPNVAEPLTTNDVDLPKKCTSLTDLVIPVVKTPSSSLEHHNSHGSDVYVPMGTPGNKYENSTHKHSDSDEEHKDDTQEPSADKEPEGMDSNVDSRDTDNIYDTVENSDHNQTVCTDEQSAAIFENAAFEDSHL